MSIDTAFDFRTDTPEGLDPDTHSPTLRRYHKLLWSKPLPDGRSFDLNDTTPGVYLHHQSELGEFRLASDSVIQTFIRWADTKPIIDQMGEAANDDFMAFASTIGGMIVFPTNKIGGAMTINGERGFNRTIADRMDLTLECIRRYYRSETSPLHGVLARYANFFALFRDFEGYVDFFLLQDLVDGDRVRFFTPFDDFHSPAVPRDLAVYRQYRDRSIELVQARNARIALISP